MLNGQVCMTAYSLGSLSSLYSGVIEVWMPNYISANLLFIFLRIQGGFLPV